jgi:hypothetical protein
VRVPGLLGLMSKAEMYLTAAAAAICECAQCLFLAGEPSKLPNWPRDTAAFSPKRGPESDTLFITLPHDRKCAGENISKCGVAPD